MNIELHGFLPKIANVVVEAIWRQIIVHLPDLVDESAVTIVHDRSFDKAGKQSPFIRVVSHRRSDFSRAYAIIEPVKMPGAGEVMTIEPLLLPGIHRYKPHK